MLERSEPGQWPLKFEGLTIIVSTGTLFLLLEQITKILYGRIWPEYLRMRVELNQEDSDDE